MLKNLSLLLALALLTLSACPRSGGGPASGSASTAVKSGARQTLVLLCSRAESDPWTSALISYAGERLALDPRGSPGEYEQIDTYGPLDGELDGQKVTLHIGLLSFDNFADLDSLNMLGGSGRKWILEKKPDAVWLDGDPASYYIGMHLDKSIPVVYSGVENDATLYYEPGRQASGVYKRHSISRVIGEIWDLAPEAKVFGLLSDDSPIDMQRLEQFKNFEQVLPEGHGMMVLAPVRAWTDFPEVLARANEYADALIICGVGSAGASEELLNTPPPPDVLKGMDIPVVVLGPSRLDHSGVLSLQLQPSAHARAALDMLSKVLGGASPLALGPLMPEEMGAFKSEQSAEEGAEPDSSAAPAPADE